MIEGISTQGFPHAHQSLLNPAGPNQITAFSRELCTPGLFHRGRGYIDLLILDLSAARTLPLLPVRCLSRCFFMSGTAAIFLFVFFMSGTAAVVFMSGTAAIFLLVFFMSGTAPFFLFVVFNSCTAASPGTGPFFVLFISTCKVAQKHCWVHLVDSSQNTSIC